MTRIHIFCEGQTEEVFVREVLGSHFQPLDVWLNPIIIRSGPEGRGGVSTYGKIKWQVENKCKEDRTAWVTTMLDFYGLPSDFPGMASGGNSMTRANAAERAFGEDIAQPNFLSNILVHEFEGLLFSAPGAFAEWFDDPTIVDKLMAVRNQFATPEEINDSQATAPSKRILAICRSYDKIAHGSLIALDIGLNIIRQECPRFDAWIKRLEALRHGVDL